MLSAVQLPGSRLGANAVALVAFSLAACSADVARFNHDPFSTAAQITKSGEDLSRTPAAGTASGSGEIFILRPKSDLANRGTSAEVVSPANSSIRNAAPGDQPIRPSRRQENPSGAFVKRNMSAVPMRANLRPANVTAITHGPPAQPAQKVAKPRSAYMGTTVVTPIFDWPVRGKILARFGSQPNGEKRQGITIAVAEGAPITSADDGIVIYAGSGLKTFGNLVLVRHPNNYVTVYAHAKELKVNRGDQVKRGDVIGSSGQTGNVDGPQVYFEIRKDSTPVDPVPLLKDSSGTNVADTLSAI